VLTGALGLVWLALWLTFYQPPATHPALTEAERNYIRAGQERHLEADGSRPSISKIIVQRNFWGIALPRFLADPTWGTLTFWLPLYLTTVRHFDLKQIALFAWLPFLAADLGCLAGGTISMTLQKRFGVRLINVAIALLSLGGFAHQTLSVTVITMSSDLFKRNEVATVAGMAGTCGNAGVLLFSLLMGGLVATIGYTPFFVGLAVLDLLGAVILWTFVREPASLVAADRAALA
jgi:ACS family hexuronate transporter-like MFS transporter